MYLDTSSPDLFQPCPLNAGRSGRWQRGKDPTIQVAVAEEEGAVGADEEEGQQGRSTR